MAREDYKMRCARCGVEAMRSELQLSYDCQGIPFRLVCSKCLDEIDDIGYDGQYYDSNDECIDYDY